MKTLNHTIILAVYITILMAITTVIADAQILIDSVIAVVNKQAITQSELVNEFRINAIINKNLPTEPNEGEKRTQLNRIIDRKFVLQDAERIGITDTNRKQQISERIAAMQQQYPSEETFNQVLQKHDIEIQALEKWLYDQIVYDDYYRLKFVNSVNRKEIEELAPQYFETNKKSFIAPATVTIRSVLVSVPKDSSDIEKQSLKTLSEDISLHFKQGDTYATVSQKYKPNPSVSFATFTLNSDTPLGEIVSQMKPNDHMGPMPVPEGFQIVELVKKRPSRQKQYSEVKDEIAVLIRNSKAETAFKKWLVKQKEDDPWYILDDALRHVSVVNLKTKE